MELKELIGLHVLRRVEIVEETPDIKIAHFTLDDYRYTVSEYRLPNGATRMEGPHVSGVASSADGSGLLVFCLHRDSAFSGHSCEDADILEIYNATTAKKVLAIGTKNIYRNSRCIIEGDPIRIVGIPGRTTLPTMPNIAFADEIHAFLDDEENVEALTDAVQELNNICINGTADRLPVGIIPTKD